MKLKFNASIFDCGWAASLCEMGNAASGGSSGTSRSRGGGGGASSGNDYNNSMVFSNGRLAAAETSEFFCWKGGVWFG
ncbi:hypothetical protein L5515_002811 [Caenorhabditis briggsae]|uniref:Uncharacterized protein n=1 Tax=Caenorhabditis briggsae TaxID=6238 RepID=A0AAE9J5I6_CAEBR|nr:hypothetical protein L5515_002811 [Caenorhabditis briggsae]